MKVTLLTEQTATNTLVRLVHDCTRFNVAVAWAGPNQVVDAMLKASGKLGKLVIGTHMYQTNPEVLRSFKPYKAVRCLPPSGRLFHPKVYLFEMSDGLAAVVGSHNLTDGAFGGNNIEASVLLEGDSGSEALSRLAAFIESHWQSAELISDEFLYSYQIQYQLHKNKRRALETFTCLSTPKAGAKGSPLDLSWAELVKGVKQDSHHSLEGRLAVLEKAVKLFTASASFATMQLDERKAIAGTYGSKEPQLGGLNWAWFGSMFGQGDFKNLINQSPQGLSTALEHIPTEGEVTEAQFDAFTHDFEQAFQGKSRTGGVPTASRLLAMKRPDVFVAVNRANDKGICAAFGVAYSTLSLQNYWERIIVPIQLSPWWLHARPRKALEGRIWDNRAALLDSIYYEP